MFTEQIPDRMAVIAPFVRSGKVLDLGAVDAHPEREGAASRLERKPDVLFRRISELNPQTVGVDIDAEGVEILRSQGHDVRCADVETMDLGEQFDAIVAGEIIEHLENPGLFLRNARRHLKPGGVLIVSTPNPFYKAQHWKIWRYGEPAVHAGHMGWQDPVTMRQLLVRCGFELTAGYWVQPHGKLLKTWPRLLRPYFSHSFLVVARPVATADQSPESRAA